MSRFWSRQVHHLTPYVPGEQPRHQRLVKLNTNENPYAPSPAVIAAIHAAADARLRLYPDPDSVQLRTRLADYHRLTPDQVFVGNGSDEVLAMVFQGLLKQEAPLLFPDISYSFYPVYCGLYDIDYQMVPLAADFSIQVSDYARPSGAVILPNPNAPTGVLLSLDAIETLLQQNSDRLLVVDEAYIDFGGTSACRLIDRYDNLLVIHTFSKSRSLAGLRIGAAFGHKDLIAGIVRIKDSFNSYSLDRLAQAAADASIADEPYFQQCRNRVITHRQQLTAELEARGFKVLPSQANFIFASPADGNAQALFKRLRNAGVIVRHFNKPARINNWLRISVGTPEQHQQLLDELDAPA